MIYVQDAVVSERQKFVDIWTKVKGYGDKSVGLEDVPRFLDICQPREAASIIDVGAGACAATQELIRRHYDAWAMDITSVAVPPGINKFYEQPIWGEWKGAFTYGFCCDVLQYVPPEYAMLCVDRMVTMCRTVWLHISFIPDAFGDQTGEPLHKTLMPYEWWLLRIGTLARVVEARDLCESGIFVVRHK